jgi:gamma-glutamyl:cysteine ligase YbdK (ATP-grasp superfamily)
MLADGQFEVSEPRLGLEIELNLVDDACDPAMANARALEAIADPAFQTELGQFNIEINVEPRPSPAAA